MAKVIDALVVTLGLDPSGYKKGAADANATHASLKQSAQASATATQQATQTAGNAQKKLANAQREREREEKKRRQDKERADRKQSQEEQASTDATIDRIKSVGLAVAGAVLGFNTLKGVLGAYVGATNQLANLGRVAPTIGTDVKALDKLGKAYEQVNGTAEDAAEEFGKIAHAQFSYAIHAPDSMAAKLRNLRVALFDDNNKPREKQQIEDDIAAAIKRQTSDLQSQAMYAREIGMSEAFIQLQLVKSNTERKEILKNADATAKATKESADAAIKAEQARARLGAHFNGAKQQIAAKISGLEAPVENIISDAWDTGDYGGAIKKLAEGYKRRATANMLSPNFQAAEKKNGLPAGSLAVLARKESGFNANIKDSPAGARGIMQIQPKYYDTANYKVGKSAEADIDKAGEILGGYYRRHISEGFDPTTAMKMAREDYNAGPTKSANVRSGKIDRHTGEPTQFTQETQDYTSKTAAYQDAFNTAYAPAQTTGASTNSTSNVHIEQLNVHTQASDASGIAATLPDALRRQNLVSQSNSGLQ